MSDDDPDRLLIRLEVRSFVSLMGMVIDEILHRGLALRQFRPVLDSRMSSMGTFGDPELVRAVADDLDHLELELQRLQELRVVGASSYIADRVESRLEAWRGVTLVAGLDIQVQQGRVDQFRGAFVDRSASLNVIDSDIVSSEARVGQLEQELRAERENLGILKMTRVNADEALTAISKELESSELKLAELKEEAAKTLGAGEESFRAELQRELQQAYDDELSKLEQQILCHKLGF